jgi:hypothetical protein
MFCQRFRLRRTHDAMRATKANTNSARQITLQKLRGYPGDAHHAEPQVFLGRDFGPTI